VTSSTIASTGVTQTEGSAVVTMAAVPAGVVVGQYVTGAGVQPGTQVASVDSATQVTLTKPVLSTTTTGTPNFIPLLSLTGGITSLNDTPAFTPTLNGGWALGADTKTVTVSGQSPVDLIINAVVVGSGGLIKAGSGTLVLSPAGGGGEHVQRGCGFATGGVGCRCDDAG
jgi:hypothetical protein